MPFWRLILLANATAKSSAYPIQSNARWVDATFLELIEARNNAKKTEERKELNKEVKKYRDKIKNKYFEKKAIAINAASEARDVEEEFRLARNHSSLNKSKDCWLHLIS